MAGLFFSWSMRVIESRELWTAIPAAVLYLFGGGLLGVLFFFLLAGVTVVLNTLLAGGWF